MAHSHSGTHCPRCSLYFTKDANPRPPSSPSTGVPLFGIRLAVDVGAWLAAPSTALGVLRVKLSYSSVLDKEISAIRRSPLKAGASLGKVIHAW